MLNIDGESKQHNRDDSTNIGLSVIECKSQRGKQSETVYEYKLFRSVATSVEHNRSIGQIRPNLYKKKSYKTMTLDLKDGPLLVKRLSSFARLPTRGSPAAAGYDLYRYISPSAHLQLQPSYIVQTNKLMSIKRFE